MKEIDPQPGEKDEKAKRALLADQAPEKSVPPETIADAEPEPGYQGFLLDKRARKAVAVTLLERIDTDYAKAVDDSWLTYIATAKAKAAAAKAPFPRIEHAHWSWFEKVKATAHLLPTPTMAVECDGETQGLMLIDTDRRLARLPSQKGLPVVYIDYLASAPWNLPLLEAVPRFGGVGTILVRAAIETSLDLGFKGRIGLHSLPQSETWYERIRMEAVGIDAHKQNLKYYEMTPEVAQAFIR